MFEKTLQKVLFGCVKNSNRFDFKFHALSNATDFLNRYLETFFVDLLLNERFNYIRKSLFRSTLGGNNTSMQETLFQ